MAYDNALAHLLRNDLAAFAATEKRMMGGLTFLLDGHMLCGVHKGGAMFRVGKHNVPAALSIPGVAPMTFTGKPMAGFVDCSDGCCRDDARRGALMALALGHIQTLPPKSPHRAVPSA